MTDQDKLPRHLRDAGARPNPEDLPLFLRIADEARKHQRPPQPPNTHRVTRDTTAWARKALEDELAALAAQTEPGRNDQLNLSAFSLFQLVGGGHLDHDDTWQALYDTARGTGLPSGEVTNTLRSASRAGMATPRQPDQQGEVETSVTVLDRASIGPTGERAEQEGEEPYAFVPGGSFILDTTLDPEPLWGVGSEVLLADGEALIIAGDQGLGKTTLGQQLALGRCGISEYSELLGYPIKLGARRTLYLAMDRPRQAARSFRRMVGEVWRAELDDRLVVWQGPPPFDLAKFPSLLLDLCRKADADTVVLDSLKDAAIGLNDDETGAGYNRARQHAIAAGVQVIELHHNRKAQQGAKGAPTINDVYGSTWLTSGVGSVVLLTGAPGDPIVGLRHLKQPADEVGPLQVIHDHATGQSRVYHATDLRALAHRPVSAVDAARTLFNTDKPTSNDKEKARRRLERGVRDGLLRVAQQGDRATSQPTLWVASGATR